MSFSRCTKSPGEEEKGNSPMRHLIQALHSCCTNYLMHLKSKLDASFLLISKGVEVGGATRLERMRSWESGMSLMPARIADDLEIQLFDKKERLTFKYSVYHLLMALLEDQKSMYQEMSHFSKEERKCLEKFDKQLSQLVGILLKFKAVREMQHILTMPVDEDEERERDILVQMKCQLNDPHMQSLLITPRTAAGGIFHKVGGEDFLEKCAQCYEQARSPAPSLKGK